MTEDEEREIAEWAEAWREYVRSLPLERLQVSNALARVARHVEWAATETPDNFSEYDANWIKEWRRNYRGKSPQAVARLIVGGLIKVNNVGHAGREELRRAMNEKHAGAAKPDEDLPDYAHRIFEGYIYIGTYEALETGAEFKTALVVEMTDDGQAAAWRKALDHFLLDDGRRAALKSVEYWTVTTITDTTPIPREWYMDRPAS